MISGYARRGFTLIEIAIVLAIIGIILGAIWGAASSVYENKKIADAEVSITTAALQVRNAYAFSLSIPNPASADITQPGWLPASWENGACAAPPCHGSPWHMNAAGNFAAVLAGSSLPLPSTQFAVELTYIDPPGCAALLTYFSSAASSTNGGPIRGLVGNFVGGMGGNDTTGGTFSYSGSGFVSPSLVSFSCAYSFVGATKISPAVVAVFDLTKM